MRWIEGIIGETEGRVGWGRFRVELEKLRVELGEIEDRKVGDCGGLGSRG